VEEKEFAQDNKIPLITDMTYGGLPC
jgi:hypothetical protein